MKINIELTWSKSMALVVVGCAFAIDLVNNLPGTVFMFSLPFAVFLITGKQLIDWRKDTPKK
jgi:hypothetical protein